MNIGMNVNVSGNYWVVNIFNSLDSRFPKIAVKLSVLDWCKNVITFDKDSHNIHRQWYCITNHILKNYECFSLWVNNIFRIWSRFDVNDDTPDSKEQEI